MLRKAFRLAVLSDIYASFIAAGIALITLASIGAPFEGLSVLAIFFTALVVYALNRQDDSDIDAINVPERTQFVTRRGWIVLAFSVAGFFSLLTYFYSVNLGVFVVMATIFILGLFYSFPLLGPLRDVLGFERLKDVLGVKNMLVGLMYGAFVFIPVFSIGAQITPLIWLLFSFISLRFFMISTIFDMRDIEGDSKKGVHTIPATFGKGRTVDLLHALNLICLGAVIYGTAAGISPPILEAMGLISFLFAAYYIEEARLESTDLRHLCSVVVEADYLPAAAIALVFLGHQFI
jgi:4-hydroxybenzoate polyprenyltransferase